MGNIIVNNDLNLNTKTELGKFIQNWALNTYNIHPDAISKYPLKFKDTLKKRACCINSPIVGIGIAGIGIDSSNNSLISQYKVNIAPFNDISGNPSQLNTVINATNCSLSNDINNNQNFFDSNTNNITNNVNDTLACKNFYDKDNNENPGLGQYVLRNRSNIDAFPSSLANIPITSDTTKLYKSPLKDQLLGLTPNISNNSNNNNGMLNPYTDCNCVNSVFAVYSELFKDNSGNTINNPSPFAQTFDSNCNSISSVWKSSNNKNDLLCFNLVNGINSSELSNINLNKQCVRTGVSSSSAGVSSSSARASTGVSSSSAGVSSSSAGVSELTSAGVSELTSTKISTPSLIKVPDVANESEHNTPTTSNNIIYIVIGVVALLIIFALISFFIVSSK
jgi:hypothetical protein